MWYYFTADGDAVDMDHYDYLALGTLESYEKVKAYYGGQRVVPIYIEVEDGMRLVKVFPTGGRIPRGIGVSPDGRWLLAAHQDSDSITCLDAETGAIVDRVEVPQPVCIKLHV